MPGINRTGQKFGRWTFIKKVANIGHHTRWLCRCDCGNEKEVYTNAVTRGKSSSCGCLNRELLGERHPHKYKAMPEYAIWNAMLGRCYRPKDLGYKNYGGRGIKVCKRWRDSFKNFIKDLGRRPNSSLTLERINNDRGYYPNNCKWATWEERMGNRRCNRKISVGGVLMTLTDMAKKSGINRNTIASRHYLYGWPPEKLMDPLRSCI